MKLTSELSGRQSDHSCMYKVGEVSWIQRWPQNVATDTVLRSNGELKRTVCFISGIFQCSYGRLTSFSK